MTTKTFALDVGGTVQGTVDRSVAIGLKVLMFAAILAIGWVVAKLLRRLTGRILDRLRFDALAVRSGVARWTGRYRAGELAARFVYHAVVLFVAQAGFSVFGPNPVSDLISGILRWLPKAFVALVLVVVAASIGRAGYEIVDGALGRLPYGPILARTSQVIISALGAVAALNQIGVATTVTEPVLITVLATVGGILVVGLGGGLIQPMRHRWERLLTRAQADSARLRTPSAGTFVQPAYQAKVATPGQDLQRPPARPAEPAPASEPAPTATAAPAVRPPGSVL